VASETRPLLNISKLNVILPYFSVPFPSFIFLSFYQVNATTEEASAVYPAGQLRTGRILAMELQLQVQCCACTKKSEQQLLK
jgi:hypothetical protein